MKKIFLSLACIGILYLLSGCKSNPATQVVYTGDVLPGTIMGNVDLYDTVFDIFTRNYVHLSDAGGVQISLEGTDLKANSTSDGAWKIENVPPGSYNIVFQKEGFATQKRPIEFAGNGTELAGFYLYRISKITPELILRPFQDYEKISIWFDTLIIDSVGQPHSTQVRDSVFVKNGKCILTVNILDSYQDLIPYQSAFLFFGKGENVSPSDPNTYLFMMENDGIDRISRSANFNVLRDDLIKAGFSIGDKVYCSAFAGKGSVQTVYEDPATFRFVYSGFSPYHSEVKNFLLP